MGGKRKTNKQKVDEDKLRLSWLNDNKGNIGKEDRKGLKIDNEEYQKQVEHVYEWIKEGLRSNEILTMLTIEDESMTQAKFIELMQYAYEYAELSLHKDREYVFQLHMDRYENMYNKSIQLTNSWGQALDPKKDWAIIRARFSNAMKSLRSKEELVGLHDKSIVLEFNDHKALVIEKEETRGKYIQGFDPDCLSLEEKKELLDIIKEARTVPIEGIQRVVIKKTVIEINANTLESQRKEVSKSIDDIEIHDIEFEEMPDDVVSKFNELKTETDEDLTDRGSVHIEDLTPTQKENKTGADVAESINNNLLEELKKRRLEKLKNK